jgi:hypothetical protein
MVTLLRRIPLNSPQQCSAYSNLKLAHGFSTLRGDLLLTRIQQPVGKAVLPRRRSGRYRHPPKRLGGDHCVLMITQHGLNMLEVLDGSLCALV